jgi:hypothetical protein
MLVFVWIIDWLQHKTPFFELKGNTQETVSLMMIESQIIPGFVLRGLK